MNNLEKEEMLTKTRDFDILQGYFEVPPRDLKCDGASLFLFNKIGTDNLLTFAKRGYIVSIVISTRIT